MRGAPTRAAFLHRLEIINRGIDPYQPSAHVRRGRINAVLVIPIAALEREKQKGGNDGDDCAGKKQTKDGAAPQQTESHEYTALQN